MGRILGAGELKAWRAWIFGVLNKFKIFKICFLAENLACGFVCAVRIKGVAIWLFSVAQMASAELGARVAVG